MNKPQPQNRLTDAPKPYHFERLPSGEKVIVLSKRIHGEKVKKKLTLEQLIDEFKRA